MDFKIIKNIFLIVSMGLGTLAHANNENGYMLIVQKNNQMVNDSIYIDLSNHPKIEFDRDYFSITDEGIKITYENAINISFVNSLPIIDNIEKNTIQKEKFAFINSNTIIISGLSDLRNLHVYTIEGKEIKLNIDYSQQEATLHLEDLSQGIYIIKTKHQSFKVVKK